MILIIRLSKTLDRARFVTPAHPQTVPHESCSRPRISRFRTDRLSPADENKFRDRATSSPENRHVHALAIAFRHQHFALRHRWVLALTISILIYVLLDEIDLG